MKRHSDKALQKTGLLEKLLGHKFIKKDKTFVFSYWNYEKGKLLFAFCEEADNSKNALYDNVKYKGLILYYQHLDDYKNTYNLICKGFDKIEKYNEIKGEYKNGQKN